MSEQIYQTILTDLHLALQSEDCEINETGAALLWAEQKIAALLARAEAAETELSTLRESMPKLLGYVHSTEFQKTFYPSIQVYEQAEAGCAIPVYTLPKPPEDSSGREIANGEGGQ